MPLTIPSRLDGWILSVIALFFNLIAISSSNYKCIDKMSKVNPLAGLIGQYDYSDDDSDEDGFSKTNVNKTDVSKLTPHTFVSQEVETSTIHPAPIPHCAWSACYDESSGFTYYWNQQTNAVTWEAPPEYLLALKLAQQQIHSSGTTEVSAAEWQLYQQALLEKQNTQNKLSIKNNSNNLTSALEKQKSVSVRKPLLAGVKRAVSESDEEKIELITSYYNSDSESNDEAETPKKAHQKSMIKPSLSQKHDFSKPSQKKQKTKSEPIEYGPVLPPNYPPPIDSEQSSVKVSSKNEEPVKDNSDKENKNVLTTEVKTSSDAIEIPENEDAQDDEVLFEKLKDKAKLLEKLGGELPNELKNLIKDEKQSGGMSPDITTKIDETSRDSKSTIDTNIDDLLEEIEKKEMPKKVLSKDKVKIDIFGDDNCEAKSRRGSSEEDKNENNSQEIKSLFPSSKNINEEPIPKVLFPISANIEQNGTVGNHTKTELTKSVVEEKKGANLYIMDSSEVVDHTIRKKLRISSSVLPEKKKSEVPTYTTKYSQFIEGVSSVRTGLGFNENDDTEMELSDRTVNYGKGLVFTKGETLNEEKKVTEETEKSDLDDTMDLLDAKLKYLCQQQTYPMSPIQEMMVQLQTLKAAWDTQSLTTAYLLKWACSARESLDRLEATAAPAGWRCHFLREAGQYAYTREADGHTQLAYPTAPAPGHDDMDISTTPPHSDEQDELQPPLPRSPMSAPAPAWADPPPPGTEPPPPPPPPRISMPPPPPPTINDTQPTKECLGDELLSFYKDIADLEKVTIEEVKSTPGSPPGPPPPPVVAGAAASETRVDIKHVDATAKGSKKKSKVKISSSMGMKHKTVSSMVAKWQQVADEITSD